MQNVVLQTAKTAPAKQAANQSNMANMGADNAVNDTPNAFAELLKKQVKQQKANTADAVDNTKPATTAATAQNKAVDTGNVDADNVASTDPTLATKADVDEKSGENLPPIQDLLLMQMGLQPAGALNTNKVNADAGTVDDKIELTGRTDSAVADPLQVTGKDTKGAVATGEFAKDLADSAAKQSGAVLDEQAVTAKEEPVLNPTLVRDKDFKEAEMKSVPVQMTAVAPAVNKLPENMVATVAAASEIPTPFGKPEWSQAVNQKVVWMVGAGDQSATLTLNPPDLGPLQVVIQVENDQVDTTFISDNPEVRQALQDGMNMLRDKMQDSGMQLGNAQVSSQAQSQRQFEQAAQQRAQQRLEQAAQGTANGQESIESRPVIQRVTNGLVDTFA